MPDININVSIKELNVPLMIVVDGGMKTHVYRQGKKVENVTAVIFTAELDEIPEITLTTHVIPED